MRFRKSTLRPMRTAVLLLITLAVLLTQLGCICTLLGTAFTTPPFQPGDRVIATRSHPLLEEATMHSKEACKIREGEGGTVLGVQYNIDELTTFVEIDMDKGCEGYTVFTNFRGLNE